MTWHIQSYNPPLVQTLSSCLGETIRGSHCSFLPLDSLTQQVSYHIHTRAHTQIYRRLHRHPYVYICMHKHTHTRYLPPLCTATSHSLFSSFKVRHQILSALHTAWRKKREHFYVTGSCSNLLVCYARSLDGYCYFLPLSVSLVVSSS